MQLAAEVDPAVPELQWLVDGVPIAAVAWPYEASWPLSRGVHRIEAVWGAKRSQPVRIEVR